MQGVVNLLCDGQIDAADLGQLIDTGAGDAPDGAEVQQQLLLPLWPDAWDRIQLRAANCTLTGLAVRADGKAVRLVAQPLQMQQRRVVRRR